MVERSFRVGLGTDIHRLGRGRPLIIGGVEIEFDRGPESHSDGDVLLHAAIDALLGAAGLGDIGEWFPDNDEQYRDADSADLLAKAVQAVHDRGWRVENIDCIVSAQRPKLSPYKANIESRLAELLGVTTDAVNVKAKTGERVGPIGRGEAIAAEAVVLISR